MLPLRPDPAIACSTEASDFSPDSPYGNQPTTPYARISYHDLARIGGLMRLLLAALFAASPASRLRRLDPSGTAMKRRPLTAARVRPMPPWSRHRGSSISSPSLCGTITKHGKCEQEEAAR